jgi:hypothetical protein
MDCTLPLKCIFHAASGHGGDAGTVEFKANSLERECFVSSYLEEAPQTFRPLVSTRNAEGLGPSEAYVERHQVSIQDLIAPWTCAINITAKSGFMDTKEMNDH